MGAAGAGEGVGVREGTGDGLGVGVKVGVGPGVGVGVGAGEGLDVGSGVGVDVGIVSSPVSPLVPLLMLPNKERDDCVSAGLITLTKHTVIISKLPIPFQLHVPSFISSFPWSYYRYPVASTTPLLLSNTNYLMTLLLQYIQVRLQP
ncbi:MAG TPA: hypothetical protein C5S37_07425 [Methanophagales archaeon]|nr:hypothetical protein [Methanophagales archaeon]